MRTGRSADWAWPGLSTLWGRGAWSGLIIAVASAVMLNLAMVASFGWTEVVSSRARFLLWLAVAGSWLAAAALSTWRRRAEELAEQEEMAGDLFPTARNEYLQGNWYEAERLLRRLIKRNDHDVDACLLLVGVLRRTARWADAREWLDRLTRLVGGEKWGAEIAAERRLLDRLAAEAAPTVAETTATNPSSAQDYGAPAGAANSDESTRNGMSAAA